MKTLVVYYSHKGHTEKVAEDIAKILGADIEKIEDQTDRSHLVNWALSVYDDDLTDPAKIATAKYNSNDYDLVIIGTPIWDGITPAVKSYLSKNKFKQVAFFITFNSAAQDAALVMSVLAKKKPVAVLEIQDLQIKKPEGSELITEFCQEIKSKI